MRPIRHVEAPDGIGPGTPLVFVRAAELGGLNELPNSLHDMKMA